MSASLPRQQRAVIAQPVGVYDGGDLQNVARDISRRGAESVAVLDQFTRQIDVLERRQQERAYNQGVTNFISGMSEVRLAAERESDPIRMREMFDQGSRALVDKIGGTVAGGEARDRFTMQAQRMIAADGVEFGRLVESRSRETGQAALLTSLETLSQAGARDPARREAVFGEAVAQIDAAVANRTLTPVEGVRQRQQFGSRMDQAAVLALGNQNPALALRALTTGQFPNLDPLTQERMVATFTNRVESQANRAASLAQVAEARAARVGRQNADRAANGLYAQIEAAREGVGTMPTLDDIARQRDWLSPGETAALLAARRGARSEEDRPTIAALQADVGRLPAAEFFPRADLAFREGRINAETFRSLTGTNRTERRDDEPPSPMRQGTTELQARLDPGTAPMSQFIRGPLEDARQNALRDFRGFIEANPQATARDVAAEVDRLTQTYRARGVSGARSNIGLPFGFTGPREQVTQQTVGQSAARLLEAQRAGRITPEALAREQSALESWGQLLGQAAPTPPPATNPRRPAAQRDTP